MLLRQLKVRADNFCYVLGDEKSREGAVIDPSADWERIAATANELEVKVRYIINTHGHPDHTGCNAILSKETGAKVALYHTSKVKHDIGLEDGDFLRLGELELKIIYTPGHTMDGICILAGGKALFAGDTLFVGECGRTDIPGASAEALRRSLFEKLMKLPDDVKVFPGHDYGPRPSSTIGEERRTNYTLKPRTKEEFVEFMAE